MQWTELLANLAKEIGLSYTELRAMDVYDFFLIMVSYEKRVNDKQ